MPRRMSTLAKSTDVAIDRDINSKYDNVVIVADNIDSVETTANAIMNVNTVADNITNVAALAPVAAAIAALYADLAAINSLYADKATLDSLYADKVTLDGLYARKTAIDALFADKATLDSLYADKAVLDNLYADKAKLDRLYTSIGNIDRVYVSIDNLDRVHTSIGSIDRVDSNIDNIDRVFASIDNIDIVGAGILNVDTVATNIADVSLVATNMADIDAVTTTILPVLPEILLADSNATIATSMAATATTQAGLADTARIAAEAAQGVAEGKANEANLSAVAADVSADLAAASEGIASTKADEAVVSAAAAHTSELAAAALLDAFDDRYLGSYSVDPTLDNDGQALLDGTLYYNTVGNVLKVYDVGSAIWYTIPQVVLSSLLDVQLTSVATGDVLSWNGSKWVNTKAITVNSVQLLGGTGPQGTVTWNTNEETLDVIQNGATLQLGQETQVHVRNNSGSSIADGKVVMATGTLGASGRITAGLYDGTADVKYVLGVATETIADGDDGKVTNFGKIRGINTSAWNEGDVLYTTTAGGLTNVAPVTGVKLAVAFVITKHAVNGVIMVRVNGVDELRYEPKNVNIQAHIASTSNPHSVTKAQVGLSNVDNTSDITKNVLSATKLTATRAIALTGDVTGTVNFDGSAGVSMTTAVGDNSHSHGDSTITDVAWSKVSGKPDPVVTVTLTGDVTGTANTTLTDLGNGTVSVATTIAANSVALGTDTTGNYVADVTAGTYITKSGTAGEGWSPTINVDATSTNTASKVVARDASGNFAAGTITAALTGNASTATKLATARNITLSGDVTGTVNFDGSAGVSITTTVADDSHLHAFTNLTSKPTTVSGYGITDAYTKTEVQTVLPKIGLDTTNVTVPEVGQIAWNQDERTIDVGVNGVTLQVGQEQLTNVRNNTGSLILNKTVLMATGTIGASGRVTVAPYAGGDPKYILGIATEDIVAGQDGFVTSFGKVRGIDTSMWAEGAVLYATTAGGLTATEPTTGVKVPVAFVVVSHASVGTLFVRVTPIDLNAYQPKDAGLTSISALTTAADKMIYTTALDTYATTTVTAAARTILDDTSVANMRTTLGISATNTPSTAVGGVVATNVQAAISELDSEMTSVNLLRADKYLAAQNVVNMAYDVNGKLSKVQYNNATDVDYEVLTYNVEGKLSNVAHYVTSVLKGNTVLGYSLGKLVSAPFTAI